MAVGVTELVEDRTTESVNEPTTTAKPVLGKLVEPETEKTIEARDDRTSQDVLEETAERVTQHTADPLDDAALEQVVRETEQGAELSEAAVGTATQTNVEKSKAVADSVTIEESEAAVDTVLKDNEVSECEAIDIGPAVTSEYGTKSAPVETAQEPPAQFAADSICVAEA